VVEQKVATDDEIDVAILTKPRVDKLVREAGARSGSGRGSDFAGSVRGDQANRDRQNVQAGQTGLNGFTSPIVWRYRQGIG
ncbi:MAG TPA: hypothetical protein VMS01_11855, partial [Stellaceae bacterium]|nr:hypothetical protein [Stellaceae bacterium]